MCRWPVDVTVPWLLMGVVVISSTSISSSKPTSLCIFEYPLHTSHAITKFVQWSSWKCQCTTALYKTVHRVATWFINSIFDLREYLTADLSLILTDHSKYYPYSYLGRSELYSLLKRISLIFAVRHVYLQSDIGRLGRFLISVRKHSTLIALTWAEWYSL